MLTAAVLLKHWQRIYKIILQVGYHWFDCLNIHIHIVQLVRCMHLMCVPMSQLNLNQVRCCCQRSCSDRGFGTDCNNSLATPSGASSYHAQEVSSLKGVQIRLLFSLYVISYSCSHFRDKTKRCSESIVCEGFA